MEKQKSFGACSVTGRGTFGAVCGRSVMEIVDMFELPFDETLARNRHHNSSPQGLWTEPCLSVQSRLSEAIESRWMIRLKNAAESCRDWRSPWPQPDSGLIVPACWIPEGSCWTGVRADGDSRNESMFTPPREGQPSPFGRRGNWTRTSVGRNGKSRARAWASSGAPNSETSNASMNSTCSPRSSP